MSAAEVVLPAIMPETSDELRADVASVTAYAPVAHLDIMDGVLVPHASWPYTEHGSVSVAALSHEYAAHIEAHLMVQSPEELGTMLVRAGVPSLVAQFEGFRDVDAARQAIAAWRAEGARRIGLSLLLDTPVADAAPLFGDIDLFQVMSIAHIGFQGEPFDVRAIARVHNVHVAYPHACICVDGGVSKDNIARLAGVGASRFAVGSAIVRASDPATAYADLVRTLERGVR